MCTQIYFRKYIQLKCSHVMHRHLLFLTENYSVRLKIHPQLELAHCSLSTFLFCRFGLNHHWWDARNRQTQQQHLEWVETFFSEKLIFYDIISANEASLIVSFRRIIFVEFSIFSFAPRHSLCKPIQVRHTDDWLFHGFLFVSFHLVSSTSTTTTTTTTFPAPARK